MMTTKCNLRQLSAVLISTAACVVLCVGILLAAPRSKKDKNPPPVPAAGDSSAIPATFFAMNNVDPRDPVRVPIGTQGHPSALVWGWVGREKGRYDWSVFDMFVKDAPKDQNGVAQIVLTLGKTPSWALSDRSSCVAKWGRDKCTKPPDNIEDWKTFLNALIDHFNGKTAPHVAYYELWNETTLQGFWTGNVEQMVALGEAAYPIIHKDPYSKLVGPSVVGPSNDKGSKAPRWLNDYLKAGGGKYMDAITFHGYIAAPAAPNWPEYPFPHEDEGGSCSGPRRERCNGSIMTMVRMLRQVADDNGLSQLPIYNTEGSWGTFTVRDPDSQMAWIAQYYIIQAGMYNQYKLQQVSWFTWGRGSQQPWGTIETDNHEPNQAGRAYIQVHDWLLGATVSPCQQEKSIWTCALTRPNCYRGLIVWSGSGDKSFSAPSGFTQYRDLTGSTQKLSGGASISVNRKPVLLESGTP